MSVQVLSPGIKPTFWALDRELVDPRYKDFWNSCLACWPVLSHSGPVGQIVDVVSRQSSLAYINAGPGLGSTPLGAAIVNSSGGANQGVRTAAVGSLLNGRDEGTIIVVATPTSLASSSENTWFRQEDGAQGVALDFFPSTKTLRFLCAGGAWTTAMDVVASDLTAGQVHVWAGRLQPTPTDTWDCIFGIPGDVSVRKSLGATGFSVGASSALCIAGSGVNGTHSCPGYTHWASIHNRALSIDEINAFTADVFGPFRPSYRRIFPVSFVAAAGAHTGTGNLSLQPITVAATGYMVPEAAAALNVASASLVASGEQPHEGAGVLSLQTASLVASGHMVPEATALLNLGNVSLTASGHMVPEATAALNLAGTSLVAVGTFDAGAYAINAVEFDGTNDYLTRGGGLTGASDSKLATFSVWIKYTSGAFIWFSDGGAFRLLFSSNVFFIIAENASGTTILNVGNGTALNDGVWHHVCGCIDMADVNATFVYIDDADVTGTPSVFTDDAIDFTVSEHVVGANTSGLLKYNGCMADFWFAPGVYVDLSVEANRRKFVASGASDVVDLGSDGSTPTGAAPLVFLSGATDSWHTNKGTGGGFTENGALTDCADTPPNPALSGAAVLTLQNAIITASGHMVPEATASLDLMLAELTASGLMVPEGQANLLLQNASLFALGVGPALGGIRNRFISVSNIRIGL